MADDSNDTNLVQQREDRRTLAKMRRKLATSGTLSAKLDSEKHKNKRTVRVWPWVAAAALILVGLNFALRTHQDKIVGAMGIQKGVTVTLTPPPGLKLDQEVLFWAYAVYDVPKLKAKFSVPKGAVLNQVIARRKLEGLLAEDLGADVRNEIFAMQQNAPPPAAPVKRLGKSKSR
ncbi:MAG: hypothetical protein M3Y08_02445 [Fibrobacterota bacterium]|nr:hypothetical protein [Fibrobacterota bacterium]